MRKQVIILTSALSRWCQVKADLIYAFEQSLQADLNDDFKLAIRSMLNRIHGGMPIDLALDKFREYSNQEQFLDLVGAVKANIIHRGDLPVLMEQLELQFFKLEEAYQQRRISNRADLRSVILCFVFGMLLTGIRYAGSSNIRNAFTSSNMGLILMSVSVVSFVFGLLLLVAIIKRINE